MTPKGARRVRRAWERFATEDPTFYITGRGGLDRDKFLEGGRNIVGRIVEVLWPDRVGPRMLEVGCGLGRTAQAFAEHCERVDAVDISPAMIDRARSLAPPPNVRFDVTSGTDVSQFPDATFDFVFSFVVFQHIPNRRVIAEMLRDVGRVTKPGGTFLVQFDTRRVPLHVRAAFALPDRLLPRVHRRGIRRHRRRPAWVRARLHDAGFRVEAEYGRYLRPLDRSGRDALHHFLARRTDRVL